MKIVKCIFLELIVFLYLFSFSFSENFLRSVAIFDTTQRNGESDGSEFSLEHALKVAGIPYILTKDVREAIKHAIVISSSYINNSTLKKEERSTLIKYVLNGGVFVVPNLTDIEFYPVFGIISEQRTNNRYSMIWNTDSLDSSLKWFDHPNEKTISLGRNTNAGVIYTRGYLINGPTPIAFFDDGTVAITKNSYGKGYTYAIGFSFIDLILRNQLNRDFNAQRTYSNGFEPTSDTIFLFIRGLYESHVPFAVWKHTSPYTSKATLIMTHDTCSSSSIAMEYLQKISEWEYQNGILATYNVVTHYFKDYLDKDYYTPYIDIYRSLVQKGFSIGSHSVGHFPDFDNEIIFPEGSPGNTQENYKPYFNGQKTIGGSVYGEIETSQSILIRDLSYPVRIFRSGYLLFNDKQINVMDALGYNYDSSMSANDVLTNFPYQCKYDRSFSGIISNIYEIPMTISDAGMTADNYSDKVSNWLEVINANANNGAPTTLLIHPNRDYKLSAEELLINQLPLDIIILDMDSFGDYWRKREDFKFISEVKRNKMKITILNDTIDESISIIVNDGRLLKDIKVTKKDGKPIKFNIADWVEKNDIIIYGFSE